MKRDARKKHLRVLLGLLFLFLSVTLYAQEKVDSLKLEEEQASRHKTLLPKDSLTYHLRGDYYTIYQRDELGAWRVAKVLSREEYFRQRTAKLHQRYYTQKERLQLLPKPKATSPRLKIDLTGQGDFRIEAEKVWDGLPSLQESQRTRRSSTIAHTSDLQLRASYGDRLALTLQYNSETALWEQRNRFLLNYRGEESDFIQNIDVGNVRFLSSNPLIHTGQELLGLRGRLRVGALELQFIMSRQQSRERSILVQGGKRVQHKELPPIQYDAFQHFFLSEFFAQKYDEALRAAPLIQSDIYITDIEVWVTRHPSYPLAADEEEVAAYYLQDLTSDTPPHSEQLHGTPLQLHYAERLAPTAYTLHPTLGFISLQVPLLKGQILAVSYRYTYQGKSYQVGDLYGGGHTYRAMLLADTDHSPQSPLWPLMMKNAYTLVSGGSTLAEGQTRVEVLFKDHQTGTEQSIIKEGEQAGRSWLDLLRLDRSNSSGEVNSPDGQFDFTDGVTIGNRGRTLFIPYRTPFVTVPEIANKGNANPYPTLTALYESTPTEASRQVGSHQYSIRVEYEGSIQQSIPLHTQKLLPGSVLVRSVTGGGTLTEGVDYQINYNEGTLTLLSEQSGTLEVVIQERHPGDRQQKNILGAELLWRPLKGLTTGATFLRYWEEEGILRPRLGQENLSNTLWGVHADYHYQSRDLPLWLNRVMKWSLQKPLTLDLALSYAALQSEYVTSDGNSEIIVEDFEQEGHFIDLTYPYQWQLGAIEDPSLRAQMAWFSVDPLLTATEHPLQPMHLKHDEAQRRHPLVTQLTYEQFFPQQATSQLRSSHVRLLNLSLYPNERGPYNVEASRLSPEGTTLQPREMIGSIAAPLPIQNLQDEGFHYLEFWLLDPYSIGLESSGEVHIDIGKIKEEILPDGLLNFEGADAKTVGEWGAVATHVPQSYSFDLNNGARLETQDTGLDGLRSQEEAQHPKYATYLEELQQIAPPESWLSSEAKSPYQDPAGDDYRFFLSPEWDQKEASILQRYRYINGLEGNAQQHPRYGLHSPTQLLPDTEDLNRNMLQEEEEAFLRYTLPITPHSLQIDQTQILSEKWIEGARWVKVRLSLHQPSEVQGTSASLQQAHTIRIQVTRAAAPIHLRLAQLRLIAHQWQQYQGVLEPQDQQRATLQLHTLSSREDYHRKPLRYLPPPGVQERPHTYHIQEGAEEEKALALSFEDLDPQQPIAIYQEKVLDLRHYQTLSLWSHLEGDPSLKTGEIELFIRLGQDPSANYYEYRQVLSPTSPEIHPDTADDALRPLLWQQQNRIEIELNQLPRLKEERYQSGTPIHHPFQKEVSSTKGRHATLLVQGNPTLAEVRFIIIGVRNKGTHPISGEVWLNELALSGSNRLGGAALQGSLFAELPDLLKLEAIGRKQDAGFASLTSDIRRLPLYAQKSWHISGTLEAGKLLPTAWQMSIPISYRMDHEIQEPLYDPYQKDILYSQNIWDIHPEEQTQRGLTRSHRRQFSIREITTRKQWAQKRPYHPNNLKLSYHLTEERRSTPDLPFAHRRSSTTELFYAYQEEPQQNAIQASSRWLRTFEYQQFTSEKKATPSTTTLHTTPQTLQSQWDWIRSLQIQREILPKLQLTLNSQTIALIEEQATHPPQDPHTSPFQWMPQKSIQSIAQLGNTRYYHGQLSLSYQTPLFRTKTLRGLSIKANWRSQYRWIKGIESQAYQIGHRISNEGRATVQLYYRFASTFPHWKHPYINHITIRYEHLQSSNLPGWLPLAGKALGIHISEQWNAPSLAYRLALTTPQKEIQRAFQKQWISTEQGTLRPPTTYGRHTLDATVQLQPITGHTLTLQWHLSTEQHQRWLSKTDAPRISGTLRFNTITKPRQVTQISEDNLIHKYLTQRVLLGGATKGLPHLAPMPSIHAEQELSQVHPWLQKYFTSIKISTGYHATLEAPNYQKMEQQGTKQQIATHYQLPSLSIQENLQPLIALDLQSKFGLAIQERYTLRKKDLLMPSSYRLSQQNEQEWSHLITYSHSFPPLFASQHPILRSQKQSITLRALYTHSQSDIQTHLLRTGDSYRTKGIQEHTLSLSTDYQLSQAIRLRLFYQYFERKALITNLQSYPFRRQNYGIALFLSLH